MSSAKDERFYHQIQRFFPNSFQKKFGNLKNSKMALLSICFSLLSFIVIFLSGVNNYDSAPPPEPDRANVIPPSDEHVEPERHGWCTAVAALLHYFLLATFAWNAMYGTQLVLLIRTNSRHLPPRWTPISLAVGWGRKHRRLNFKKKQNNLINVN